MTGRPISHTTALCLATALLAPHAAATAQTAAVPASPAVVPGVRNANAIEFPAPRFPEIPPQHYNNASSIQWKDLFVGTDRKTYGAAVTSLKYRGVEYVLNEGTHNPHQKRGASLQATLFFDQKTPNMFYNECNNPLEAGSFSQWDQGHFGITSPAILYSPRPGVLWSRSQLAYWVDPKNCRNGQATPLTYKVDHQALSDTYIGKAITLGNIGSESRPTVLHNVVVIDLVVYTQSDHTSVQIDAMSGNHDPDRFPHFWTYDPRSKVLCRGPARIYPQGAPGSDSKEPTWSSLPTLIASRDGKAAMGVYLPQIPLSGEGSGLSLGGYSRTSFLDNGVSEWEAWIRPPRYPAGLYSYKVFLAVGTIEEVRQAFDVLYCGFKVLGPGEFDWKYYVAANRLGMTEDQARLHWLTTGHRRGLKATPP